MNVIFLFAGSSKAFEVSGYSYPKPLLELGGQTLLERVAGSYKTLLASARPIFLVLKEENRRFHLESIVKLLFDPATVIEVERPTAGAACTALLAVEHIDNDEPLVIINGDQLLLADCKEAVDDFSRRKLDGGAMVFESVHPRWSYVRCDSSELVVEAAEKRPISRHATGGFYYFARGRDFVECAMSMIAKDNDLGGAFFVCPVFNEMILRQKRIGIFRIPEGRYISLMTPDLVERAQAYFDIGLGSGKISP